MKVTVTGGAGYIGCVLVPMLLERGHEVQVFDKLFFGDYGLEPVLGQIDLVKGDIREFPSEILEGQDAVIHLAALSNDPTAEYNPKANHEINTVGALEVAKACVEKNVPKYIMASSCSVYYTPTPTDIFFDETSKVNPSAPYSKSKIEAEREIIKLKSEEFHPCFLRKGTVFGYSPKMRYDLVVNAMTKYSYTTGVMNVFAGGEMYRPLIDIKDVSLAYITCLNAPNEKISGQVFNILHKNYIILALAHWVKYALRDKKDIRVNVDYEKGNTRSYRVDASKIERELGFRAELGITQAVNEIWSKIEEGKCNDFDNPKYYNIRWMETLVEMKETLKDMGRIF